MATQPPPPTRTASVGPPSAGGMNAPSVSTPGAGGANNQQNLNQIVLEYLNKKGYSRTEAMLRKESFNHAPDGSAEGLQSWEEKIGGARWYMAFKLVRDWIENIMDIYKPELRRLLWPIFVHAFLDCVSDCFFNDAQKFFADWKGMFEEEHKDDLNALNGVSQPEHVQTNEIAKLYRENKYRLSMSNMGFAELLNFLESKSDQGGRTINHIITNHLDIRKTVRATTGGAQDLARLMSEKRGDEKAPAEDEGIPGHDPGSVKVGQEATSTLMRLQLAPLQPDADLMEDVKAELSHEDSVHPREPSLVSEMEQRIKIEGGEEQPQQHKPPFPPSTARDVAMEVQKIKENRDRFRIDGKERTGGVGPAVSVTMFTFHNTFDSINCIEFSGDYTLVAIGTAESYIRIWSLENKALTSPHDPPGFQPSSSRRLIGHAGPVFGLSFSSSAALPEPATNGHTTSSISSDSQPRYMLSCSADATIRLWSLDTWSNLVVYRSHNSPVWDVRFCPHGHYFVSASADRTARLWSTPEITPLRLFVGHDSDVEAIAWHPNGAYVFTGAGVGDRTVRMWSLTSGNAVRIFTGHAGNITAIACAPNGLTVASADDKGVIVLWDLKGGRIVKRMRGHGAGGIWSLDWSVESTVLVSGGADNSVRVWDVQPNKEAINKASGEAGATKIDGATVGGGGTVSKTGKSKGREQATPDMISDFKTKRSPVYKVQFTRMNLVMAGGAFFPQ